MIDRSQFIHGIPENDSAESFLMADLPRLKRRAALLNRSLFSAIVAAIFTALIIIVAFVSALLQFAHEYGVAILFMVALLTFCASRRSSARDEARASRQRPARLARFAFNAFATAEFTCRRIRARADKEANRARHRALPSRLGLPH